MFLGGIQLMLLGILGTYLGNVNDEVRRRPAYIVRKYHGSVPSTSGAGKSPDAAAGEDPG